MFTLSVECGLSVLGHPYINTLGPNWQSATRANPAIAANLTSSPTRESVTEPAIITLGNETMTESRSTKDDTFLSKSVDTAKNVEKYIS